MSIWNVVALFPVAGAVVFAVRWMGRARKPACTGDCASCACACNQRKSGDQA